MKIEISQGTIDAMRAISVQNQRDYEEQQALESTATQARHVAGQAVMKRPKLAHLMALAADNDERGLDSLIALAVHNQRYAKG